jgi:hypothetical protein
LGGRQSIEKDKERLEIENRKESGGSKSQKPMEGETVAIKRTTENPLPAHKTTQDWMRKVSV